MTSTKQRHGCLTAWLILMIIANGFAAIVTPAMAAQLQQANPNFPTWIVWPIALLGVLNVVFTIVLFNWKMWGFVGFCVNALIAFGLNLYAGIGVGQAIFGLTGIAVLFGVLQIGGKDKGWSQLE